MAGPAGYQPSLGAVFARAKRREGKWKYATKGTGKLGRVNEIANMISIPFK